MTNQKLLKQIQHIKIFKELTADQLKIVVSEFKHGKFSKDDIIISQNKLKKELFIVVKGTVVSTLKLPGTIERHYSKYLPGDFFGEIYLGGNKPLYNSYIATEDSELLSISEDGLIKLIENCPECFIPFVSSLLSQIIIQFRKSSKFLADVVQWGEHASRRVITDDLTGIYNRAFLEDAIENFFYISKNNNKSLSFLMLDVDNCRVINNELGHETGNKILHKIVLIIKECINQIGIMARYGGDEFSILLPEMDLQNSLKIAETIRASVETTDFSAFLKGRDIPVTTSIGVSSYPETASELEIFKQKADSSLYRAKELGRNRVESIE